MRFMLLGIVAPLALAAAAIPAPLSAQSFAPQQFSDSGDGPRVHRNGPGGFINGGFGRLQGCSVGGDHRGHRGRDGSCDISVGTWVNGGEWALYNNRSWESDSYNDWWHDRPDRSYPRWVTNNQDCARQWWQGGAWRC